MRHKDKVFVSLDAKTKPGYLRSGKLVIFSKTPLSMSWLLNESGQLALGDAPDGFQVDEYQDEISTLQELMVPILDASNCPKANESVSAKGRWEAIAALQRSKIMHQLDGFLG